MPNSSLTIAALLGIAEDDENPDEIRLRAWVAVARFVEPTLQMPDARTTQKLTRLHVQLLKCIDAVTPRRAPVRKMPEPWRWVN